jgi:hypothetical protein
MTSKVSNAPGLAARSLRLLDLVGIDAARLWLVVRGLPKYVGDCRRYRRSSGLNSFTLNIRNLQPVLWESREPAGTARGHYFWQDLWAARKIFRRRPGTHVDVASRLDGFVAHLLTFMPVTYVDIRPVQEPVDGLTVLQDDLIELRCFAPRSVESLSCLHAVEHAGLGRYGDRIAPDDWKLAIASLTRVLAPGGVLYLSVPVGSERLRFNAHRVFSPQTILEAARPLHLASFALVDDEGRFNSSGDLEAASRLRFGCGCFELVNQS